jgi:LuxR family maltose regulon positive regulatory protein
MTDLWTMTGQAIQVGQAGSRLAAKYRLPALRAERVLRPWLIRRLDEAVAAERRVVLVSAPLGYGKTTLLAEWAAQSACPTAWISLDKEDDSVEGFWRSLTAALAGIEPDWGRLSAGPMEEERLWSALAQVRERFPHGAALVLDDYQVLQAAEVQRLVARLVERLPAGVCLVIATRREPALALGQLRARNQLAELRAGDLRFTEEESGAFLNGVMGLNVSAEGVAALARRTEGWIAGLQLAALALQGREDAEALAHSFSGSHRYIRDYLEEQVLGRLSERQVSFLLQTATLERMNANLCAAVSGQVESQAMLETLEQQNCFLVALDDERGWYRYHRLFADFLRQRRQQRQRQGVRPDPPALPDLVEPLTGREQEILRLIAEGASNRQIAGELVLTVNTVKKHTSHIFGKLGVSTRTQAAARARSDRFL